MWNCYPNLKNDGDCVLAKYTDEEIIELARLNPGYGVRRMATHLYPGGKSDTNEVASKITIILKENEEEFAKRVIGPTINNYIQSKKGKETIKICLNEAI